MGKTLKDRYRRDAEDVPGGSLKAAQLHERRRDKYRLSKNSYFNEDED